MKNLLVVIPFGLMSFNAFCQDDGAKLNDLTTPNSPGFQLLDLSPSSIERPTNPKEFSLKVLNLINEGTTIPKNFALEFSPYWIFEHKHETVYKYLGVNKNGLYENANVSSGVLRKANLSLVSNYSDSTKGSLLQKTNYVSIGLRTNLVTVRSGKQNKKINSALIQAAQKLHSLHGRHLTDEDEKNLDEDKNYVSDMETASKLPLLQLDIAYAYSEAFPDNSYNNRRFNRYGLWSTLAVNADFKDKDVSNHSLSLIFLVKYLNDNVLADTTNNKFTRKVGFDYGSKIEYIYNRFSFSIEYVKRNYGNAEKLSSERTVGVLQYKISDKLYASATYGKNFGNIKNLFSIIGLNWGFGNSKLNIE